jgi:hypothetical protein
VAELDPALLEAERRGIDGAISEARAALRRLQRLRDRLQAPTGDGLETPVAEAEEAVQRLLERLEQKRAEQRRLARRSLRGENAEL